jgi:hypothetical protein
MNIYWNVFVSAKEFGGVCYVGLSSRLMLLGMGILLAKTTSVNTKYFFQVVSCHIIFNVNLYQRMGGVFCDQASHSLYMVAMPFAECKNVITKVFWQAGNVHV